MKAAYNLSSVESDCQRCVFSLVCMAGRLPEKTRMACVRCMQVWARGPHYSYRCGETGVIQATTENINFICSDCSLRFFR